MSDADAYFPPPPPLRRYIRIPVEERTHVWERYRPGPVVIRPRHRFRPRNIDVAHPDLPPPPPPKRARHHE